MGDQDMLFFVYALNFIKSDGTSDVVLGDAKAVEGEDVVARTAEARLVPSGKYVNVSKGFTKASSSKPSTRRSSHRLLKGPNQSSATEPIDLSDEIEVFADQWVEAEGKKGKELPVVVGKTVDVSTAKGSSRKSREGSVEVGDNFKSSVVCECVLTNFAPLMVMDSLTAMDDDVVISRMIMSAYNFAAMLLEGVSHFRRRMHEYKEFSKNKDKMKASMAALKKESEGFAEKEKACVMKVGELTSRHEVEMNGLKKRMEADKLQLKADREALNVQKKVFLEEKERLKASLAYATNNNQWLIEHGLQQVVTYLLHSTEFNSALSDVYTKLINHGKHLGFVAGYKAHESSQPQEQSSFYQPQSFATFKESVLNMEWLTYPYVGEVSSCFGKPLSVLHELKPSGLNEVVCAEVLKSLSKKRSHSGDSEETFLDGAEGSLEASLEGSELAGDGGKKVK
ncbi:hypothetical protein Hanom_Chr12g01116651 [Helianthus anomalus]